MSDLPIPPVPAGCDLRDFPFYQIDVVRLRDSELVGAADAEVFRCAVLSWCYAWHQVPAGSLPDDDATLARALGFGRDVRGWRRIRTAGGLRGWFKANDGRLYHRIVAEKVMAAWQRKLQQRWQTECARIKKNNQRHGTATPCPDFDAWLSNGCPQGQAQDVPGDMDGDRGDRKASKGQGEGQGQGEGEGDSAPATPPAPGSDLEVQRESNRKALRKAMLRLALPGSAEAVEAWGAALQGAGARTTDEVINALSWLITKARENGIDHDWPRKVPGLLGEVAGVIRRQHLREAREAQGAA